MKKAGRSAEGFLKRMGKTLRDQISEKKKYVEVRRKQKGSKNVVFRRLVHMGEENEIQQGKGEAVSASRKKKV